MNLTWISSGSHQPRPLFWLAYLCDFKNEETFRAIRGRTLKPKRNCRAFFRIAPFGWDTSFSYFTLASSDLPTSNPENEFLRHTNAKEITSESCLISPIFRKHIPGIYGEGEQVSTHLLIESKHTASCSAASPCSSLCIQITLYWPSNSIPTGSWIVIN